MSAATGPTQVRLPWQARLPFYYGWVIVGIAFVLMFLTSSVQLWGFGVLVVPMQEELGWSRTAFYFPLTIRAILSAGGAPFFSRYLDRKYGAPIMLSIGSIMNAITLYLAAHVNSEWQFLVLFGIVGGIANLGQAAGLSGIIIPKWFTRRRGRAIAFATSGSGSAGFVAPLVLTALIASVDWRATWIVLSVVTLVISVPLALFVRRQPEDIGLEPDAPRQAPGAARPTPAPEQSFTAREAIHSRTFWMLITSQMLVSLTMVGFPVNAIPMFVEKEFTLDTAAAALSVWAGASVVGRFTLGYIMERTGVRFAFLGLAVWMVLVLTLHLTALVNAPLLFTVAFMTGFGIGGAIVLNQSIWPTYFGRGHLGAISGFVRPFSAISSGGSASLIPLIFDWSGSYAPALFMILVAWIGAGSILYIVRPMQPVIREAPAEAG